jgi:predicted dehydrogenase
LPRSNDIKESRSPSREGYGKITERYGAAIIGLGQIGNLFDDDPKRSEVWTHAGAYAAVPEIELVAGADPDPDRLDRFTARREGAAGYRDYREMLRAEPIHLLSVCAPTALHHEMVMEGVKAGVKGIFCEKPLASTMEEGTEMVEACESAGVVLAVNHTRRWESIYRHAKRLVDQGAIGSLESVVGSYPGKVFTMGTHLFDLMRYFGGEVEWVCGQGDDERKTEPSLSGLLQFRSSVPGFIVSGRDRSNHIFELDLVGSRGRLRLSGDGGRLDLSRYEDSPRYSGYRELASRLLEEPVPAQSENRFVTAVRDLLVCVQTGGTPACSGRDGTAALEIAWGLCESVRQGHVRMDLPLKHSSPVAIR